MIIKNTFKLPTKKTNPLIGELTTKLDLSLNNNQNVINENRFGRIGDNNNKIGKICLSNEEDVIKNIIRNEKSKKKGRKKGRKKRKKDIIQINVNVYNFYINLFRRRNI